MMPNKNIVVAIDGPAGSGKSTVSKLLAQKLNFLYVDTGAMYRAATLYFYEKGVIDSADDMAKNIKKADIKLSGDKVYLNGKDVSAEIRNPALEPRIKKTACLAEVRDYLVELQRGYKKDTSIVMEGRDIGTVVFPDAEVKIYLEADPGERAKRRYDELVKRGVKVDFNEILKEIINRDEADKTRDIAPLKKAPDADEVDTTGLSINEVVDKIYEIVKKKTV